MGFAVSRGNEQPDRVPTAAARGSGEDELVRLLRTVARSSRHGATPERRGAMLDAVPEAYVLTGADGRIWVLNEVASTLVGRASTLPEVLGRAGAQQVLDAGRTDEVHLVHGLRLRSGEHVDAQVVVEGDTGVRHVLLLPGRAGRRVPAAGPVLGSGEPAAAVDDVPAVVYEARVGDTWAPTWVAAAVRDLTGDDPRDWITDPDTWTDRIEQPDREHVERSRRAARRDGYASFSYRMRSRSGDVRWVEDRVTVRDGRAHGVLFDVTRHSRLATAWEELLGMLLEQLEDLGRLASSRETAVQVFAHDLRSPLAMVASLLESLASQDEGLEASSSGGLLGALVGGVRSTLDVVEEITEFVGLEHRDGPGAWRRVDLADVVDRALSRFDEDLVQLSDDGGRPLLWADAVMLERAVANLVDNAIGHGGGNRVEVTLQGDGDLVTICVEDRGPGVPDDLKSVVFEPFCRGVAADRGGLGLGLALVHRIAAMHGGSTWVRDREGGGASFGLVVSRGRRATRRDAGPGHVADVPSPGPRAALRGA